MQAQQSCLSLPAFKRVAIQICDSAAQGNVSLFPSTLNDPALLWAGSVLFSAAKIVKL